MNYKETIEQQIEILIRLNQQLADQPAPIWQGKRVRRRRAII